MSDRDYGGERSKAAVRTAIMLGAKFEQDMLGQWTIEGVNYRSKFKEVLAWLYLSMHGIDIDENGKPCLEIHVPITE